MSDPYLKHAYIADDSEAMVENIVDLIKASEELTADNINTYKRLIERFKKKIKKEQEHLISYLREHGIDESMVVSSFVTGDDVFPDSKSEPVQSYLPNDKAAEKTHTSQEAAALKDVAANESGMNDYIRDRIDRIYKAKNMLSKITAKLNKAQNLQGSSIRTKDQNKDAYNALKKKNKNLSILIGKLVAFENLFTAIPKTRTSVKAMMEQDNRMDVFCPAYVIKKQDIISDAADFMEESEDETLRVRIDGLVDYLGGLPKQYVDAMSLSDLIIVALDTQIENLSLALTESLGELNTLAGSAGIHNRELENLRRSIISVFRSRVKEKVVTRVTRDQMLAQNKDDIDTSKEKADRFVTVLEKIGSSMAQGPQVVGTLLNEFGKNLFNKAVLMTGFPVRNEKESKEVLWDNRREIVRARYGGDIPFCDEVVVEHADGSREFVKKIEATEISEGVYAKTSDLLRDQYLRDYAENESDIYGGP